MPVHEADAVVLRHYSLAEADRIIVLLTREFGKLRATAQGVKRPKSRLAGALEPLNHIRLQFYAREGAELGRIRQAELVHSYLGKSPSLARLFAFSYFAEIANEFVEENLANDPFYRLLLAALDTGERIGISEGLVRYFEIWTLRLSGLLASYDYCSSCGRCVKDDEFFVSPEAGQGRCQACAGGKGVRVAPEGARLLDSIFRLSPQNFAAAPAPDQAVRELEKLTQRLFGLHLEKQIKSYKSLREVLRGGMG